MLSNYRKSWATPATIAISNGRRMAGNPEVFPDKPSEVPPDAPSETPPSAPPEAPPTIPEEAPPSAPPEVPPKMPQGGRRFLKKGCGKK